MRAFLSYSLDDHRMFVVTLLARRLKERGFRIINGEYNATNEIDEMSARKIDICSLFIGIISVDGQFSERVRKEWQLAVSKNIPALLFVEDTLSVSPSLDRHPNVIRFNRYKPEAAISKIKLNLSKPTKVGNSAQDAAAWVLGGSALIALVKLLAVEE